MDSMLCVAEYSRYLSSSRLDSSPDLQGLTNSMKNFSLEILWLLQELQRRQNDAKYDGINTTLAGNYGAHNFWAENCSTVFECSSNLTYVHCTSTLHTSAILDGRIVFESSCLAHELQFPDIVEQLLYYVY
jgi:hypothetical protein